MISPDNNPGEPEIAAVQQVQVPAASLNPFDPAKAWVFGLLATILAGGMLGSLSQYLSVAPMLVVSLLVVRRRRLSVGEVYMLKRPRLADLRLPIAFAVSFGCAEMLLFEGIDYATRGGFSRVGELLSGIPDDSFPIVALFAVSVVPLVEELFFRGFFMSSLAGMGRGWTVMLPSLFFALAHNPLKWPTTLISALTWSVFVLETGSIAAGIAGHAANNLLGVLLPLVYHVFPRAAGDVAYSIFLTAGAAMGFLLRHQIKALWLRVREYWIDFRKAPGVVGGAKLLLKRWPYWVVLAMFIVTVCLYVAVIVRGQPIEVG